MKGSVERLFEQNPCRGDRYSGLQQSWSQVRLRNINYAYLGILVREDVVGIQWSMELWIPSLDRSCRRGVWSFLALLLSLLLITCTVLAFDGDEDIHIIFCTGHVQNSPDGRKTVLGAVRTHPPAGKGKRVALSHQLVQLHLNKLSKGTINSFRTALQNVKVPSLSDNPLFKTKVGIDSQESGIVKSVQTLSVQTHNHYINNPENGTTKLIRVHTSHIDLGDDWPVSKMPDVYLEGDTLNGREEKGPAGTVRILRQGNDIYPLVEVMPTGGGTTTLVVGKYTLDTDCTLSTGMDAQQKVVINLTQLYCLVIGDWFTQIVKTRPKNNQDKVGQDVLYQYPTASFYPGVSAAAGRGARQYPITIFQVLTGNDRPIAAAPLLPSSETILPNVQQEDSGFISVVQDMLQNASLMPHPDLHQNDTPEDTSNLFQGTVPKICVGESYKFRRQQESKKEGAIFVQRKTDVSSHSYAGQAVDTFLYNTSSGKQQ